ncbi:unnamed protein product [Camellia sinensis]
MKFALFGNLSRRHRGEETPIKRLGPEGVKNSKGIQAKAEEKVVQTNDKLSSNELKAFVLPSNQQEKKKVIGKKVDRIQKVALRAKKPEEMEKVKSKAVSKSHDEAKVTSTKQRKPKTGSIIAKSCISQQKSTSSSCNSKHTTPAISCNRGDREKNLNNEKPSKEPLAANSVVENVGCKYGDKSIDLSCENESDMTRTGTTTADQLLPKERTDSSEFQSKDQYDSHQSSVCNVIPQTTQQESLTKSSEEANHCINSTEKKCFRTETNVPNMWGEDELHNVVQMGFNSSAPLDSQDLTDSKIWSPTGEWTISKAYSRFLVDDDLWSFHIIGALSVIPWFRSPFLGVSLVFMLLYVWSREFPNANINIYGLVSLKAFYLPWAMLALDVIFGSKLQPDLLGIVAGHLYYFLTVLHPLAGGKNILKTPTWLQKQ